MAIELSNVTLDGIVLLKMVTDHLKSVYAELKEVVSPEINYHRYKQEIISSLNQAPCVPKLGMN